MAQRRKVSNLLALGVLALLVPGEALHPYRIATLLRETGKEHDMGIKWGSFYTVIANLEKHGFIEAVEENRAGRRPERTEYVITPAGRAEMHDWLSELVGTPATEAGTFESALSVLGVLPPDDVVRLLNERLSRLTGDIESMKADLAASTQVPRVFLIEVEFALAMREAEAAWVRHLLTELDEGTMSGLAEWREWHEHGSRPEHWDAMLAERFEGGEPSGDASPGESAATATAAPAVAEPPAKKKAKKPSAKTSAHGDSGRLPKVTWEPFGTDGTGTNDGAGENDAAGEKNPAGGTNEAGSAPAPDPRHPHQEGEA